jgi:chemotaxis protein methyltransferase WspC
MSHATALVAAQALSSLGMNAAVLQESNVHRAIRRRMRIVALTNTETYAELYRGSADEQAALAEELYIRETFFFRDRGVFVELKRWCDRWFSQHRRPLKILSAPCSTGEEPYSVAATMYEMGIKSERYCIDALDISHVALRRAAEGIYGGLSLRNLPGAEREVVLTPAIGGWEVREHLRASVRLLHGNLLQASVVEGQSYDLILCRNLFLYLDSTARERLASNLLHWLRPGGRIVLGAADWSRDLEQFFRLEEPANSFAVRAVVEPQTIAPDVLYAGMVGSPVVAESASQALEQYPDEDPQLFYRRAVAAYGERSPELAERFCRQALYLEPTHLPSLELLSRLWKVHASARLNHALAVRLSRTREHAARGAQ